jgi:hypothetical protein
MASLSGIITFIKHIIFVVIFILFIPGFFFQLPKSGGQHAVAAVHGLLYALVYTVLEVLFNIKRIIMCIKGGGMGSV